MAARPELPRVGAGGYLAVLVYRRVACPAGWARSQILAGGAVHATQVVAALRPYQGRQRPSCGCIIRDDAADVGSCPAIFVLLLGCARWMWMVLLPGRRPRLTVLVVLRFVFHDGLPASIVGLSARVFVRRRLVFWYADGFLLVEHSNGALFGAPFVWSIRAGGCQPHTNGSAGGSVCWYGPLNL